MSQADETTLLRDGLLHGEAAAQEQFLQQLAPVVFQLVVRMIHNEQDAEELTQDTLLRAMQHIGDYDSHRATLKTWVSRIAYRLSLNHLRNSGVTLLSIEESPAAAEAEENAMVRAFAQADDSLTELLRQAIDYLPPNEQTLISLFYFDDLPLREIAFITDAPPGTIATRLHRIRRKLYHLILKLQQQ